jgi:hypothetical protein
MYVDMRAAESYLFVVYLTMLSIVQIITSSGDTMIIE